MHCYMLIMKNNANVDIDLDKDIYYCSTYLYEKSFHFSI